MISPTLEVLIQVCIYRLWIVLKSGDQCTLDTTRPTPWIYYWYLYTHFFTKDSQVYFRASLTRYTGLEKKVEDNNAFAMQVIFAVLHI